MSTMMDNMAEALSQLLGAEVHIQRVQEPSSYERMHGLTSRPTYHLSFKKGEESFTIKVSQNANEVKRIIALLSDLLQRGIIMEDLNDPA